MKSLIRQYEFNVSRNSAYVSDAALSKCPPASFPIRIIAYYLPQFHRIIENDEWWGPGFTEWTNVTKAIPRYAGHLQPRLPADLGFYDLSQEDIIRSQAGLAKRAGLAGFCIHNYWFSGRRLLEQPLDTILANKDIELPFCLNWANENWTRRWDGLESEILLKQTYDPSNPDGYIKSILPALEDNRYIKIDGRPIIMIYRPAVIPDALKMFDSWRVFLDKRGYGNPFLMMAPIAGKDDPRQFGLDAVAGFPPHGARIWQSNEVDQVKLFDPEYGGRVHKYSYLVSEMTSNHGQEYKSFPGVAPGWDNEARKPGKGVSFYGASPPQYAAWLMKAAHQAMKLSNKDERIVFVNAWNEWGEGAVLEPDRHFGHAFLVATRQVIDSLLAGSSSQFEHDVRQFKSTMKTDISTLARRLFNKGRRKAINLQKRLINDR